MEKKETKIVNIQGVSFDLNASDTKKMSQKRFMEICGTERKSKKDGKPVTLPSLMAKPEKGWKALQRHLGK